MGYIRNSIYIFISLILVTVNSFALKAEYRFEDCNRDSSSKNFTGDSDLDGNLDGNAKIGTGKIVYGLNLDGNGYMSVPHNSELDLVNNLTISFWVYPKNRDRQALIVKGNGVGDDRKFGSGAEYSLVLWEDGKFKYKHNETADTFSKSIIPLNKWTHIVVVRDNDSKTIQIYINGVLDTENSYTIEPKTSGSEDLIIGSGDYYSDSMDNFIGYIDEIKIYNVALSDNDISVMYDKESNGIYYSRECNTHTSPEAQNDKSDIPPSGTALVDILLNDITYDNCELNRTSIELYSNNDNATLSEDNRTLTMSNEGVWSVDTSKGVVKFVSNKDFYSNPTPIYYRVKDNCGAWSNRADIMLYRVVVESTSSTVTPIPVITPTVTSETEPISTVATPTPMPTEDVSVVEPTSSISQDYDVNLKLGDRVWIDVNENGIQDNKEVGLKGIIVTLFTENGQKVETTTTNSNGYYLFSNLSRGNYYLSFRNIPSECKFTIKDAISDDTKDSDADKMGISWIYNWIVAFYQMMLALYVK